jgi:hypothetical protein
MSKRVQIGDHAALSGQNEDWWYFVVADDGRQSVEHRWKSPGSEGTKSVPVDEFLAGDYTDSIRDAVRAEIKKSS